ncbi:MAG: LptF/LptG family permease [Alistipes inops]
MKTLDKFILKSYIGPMILTFFIVSFIFLMNFLWLYIDDLVGKGLDFGVILELLGYASATTIPMSLPLATLLAAIMTMGNLGENNELLAMKSAGISLPRILAPLTVLVVFIAIGSFSPPTTSCLMPEADERTHRRYPSAEADHRIQRRSLLQWYRRHEYPG